VIAPREMNLKIVERNGATQTRREDRDGMTLRMWERSDAIAPPLEVFVPAGSVLPSVSVAPADDGRDRLRDALIDAARGGPHVTEALLDLNLSPSMTDAEKARRLYRYVAGKIEPSAPEWTGVSGEETLASTGGSRTSALLALAQSAGLKAGLLLA